MVNHAMPVKVFFFGDSICVGQYVSVHRGWVTRISARLSELARERGRDLTVLNSSVNGRITRQALEHMPYEVQAHAPDFLIVQFGMNDCNYWRTDLGVPRVSPKAFAANLEEIITRAFVCGVNAVFLNTNHPTGLDQEPLPHTTISYQESNCRYNQIIREVAAGQDYRVVLNDIERVFIERTGGRRDKLVELLQGEPDLLHLSERGHDLYFDAIYPVIERAILDPTTTKALS